MLGTALAACDWMRAPTSKALLDSLDGGGPVGVVRLQAAILLPHQGVGCPYALCHRVNLLSCFQCRHLCKI